MATATIQNRTRIAGAGFTLFTFGGQPITFCQQVAQTSPSAVAPPSYIQPMDEPYVVEILNSPAAGPGTITLGLIELFGSGGHASKVWDRLGVHVGGSLSQPFGAPNTNGLYNTSQYLANVTPGLGPFAGAVDIVDIFIRQAQLDPTKMSVTKIVRPLPKPGQSTGVPIYTEGYIGCSIVDVTDGETVVVGTKELVKQITVAYRYTTRNGVPSQAFAVRDGSLPNINPRAV